MLKLSILMVIFSFVVGCSTKTSPSPDSSTEETLKAQMRFEMPETPKNKPSFSRHGVTSLTRERNRL